MTVDDNAGYGVERKAISVANGQTVSDMAEFSRPYAFFLVVIADCQYNQASNALTAQVGVLPNTAVADLYHLADATTLTKFAFDLPTTAVSCAFVLPHALGARFLRFTFGVAPSGGDTDFVVYGLDQAVDAVEV